jgi:cellulose biosynthesis protein BcsQ
MKVIGVYNSKGGVGKTTSCVNLSYLASMDKRKVLVWDIDPQGSATYYFNVRAGFKGGAKKMIKGKGHIGDYVKPTDYDFIDILPADLSERHLDIILDDMKHSKKQFRTFLKEFEKFYDYIFIDSPPGFSLLSENLFIAADYILMPLIPTPLSIRAYEQVARYYEENSLDTGRILPFFSQADIRKKIHQEFIAAYSSKNKGFLKSYIPYSSEVEKMGIRRAPLPAYSKKSKPALCSVGLWEEIMLRIGKDD